MPTPVPKTLRERALRAGGWSFFGYGVTQVIRLATTLVMTRLLVPEMYGVMAVATMVATILSLISDLGVHQNIVQSRRSDEPAFLNTAWTLGVIRGIVLWLVAVFVAFLVFIANRFGLVPLDSVYAAPLLPFVIGTSSFTAVTASFASTRISVAVRQFNQKKIIQIELMSQVSALVVMIVIGVATRSIWALVSGSIVSSLVRTFLSHTWMSGLPNRFHWEKETLRELVGFGKWIYLSSIMSVLAAQGDRMMLAGFLNAETMGLYAIATLITGMLESALVRLLATVSLPALSEVARLDPARLREVYYKFRAVSDLVLLFFAGLLFAAGQLVIDLLYDHRYSAAGDMLQILVLSVLAVRYGVAQQIYLAIGKPQYMTYVNAVQFVALFTVVPFLYYAAGVQAAIWGIALHGLATVPLVFFLNAKLDLNDFRRELIFLAALPAGFLCGTALRILWS